MKASKKQWLRIAGICYVLLMLWLLFGQRIGWSGYGDYWSQVHGSLNLIPFRTIAKYVPALAGDSVDWQRHAWINLLGNIVMFLPLGLLLPALYPRLRRFGRFLLFCAALIAAVELTQLFTLLGSCDVDDLLLNLTGASMGFGLYQLITWGYQQSKRGNANGKAS